MAVKKAAKRASTTPGTEDPVLKTIAGLVAERGQHGLHRLLNDRVRLGIVSSLAVSDSLSFNELKELLGASDGNLSVHARKLEDGGYIECQKSFAGRRPRTEYSLTGKGRKGLKRYLQHMEALIQATDI